MRTLAHIFVLLAAWQIDMAVEMGMQCHKCVRQPAKAKVVPAPARPVAAPAVVTHPPVCVEEPCEIPQQWYVRPAPMQYQYQYKRTYRR